MRNAFNVLLVILWWLLVAALAVAAAVDMTEGNHALAATRIMLASVLAGGWFRDRDVRRLTDENARLRACIESRPIGLVDMRGRQ